MVPVLKKLKVWTLYVHIVAQVNYMGLGVKLRDSNLISRSFLSTTFSRLFHSFNKLTDKTTQ